MENEIIEKEIIGSPYFIHTSDQENFYVVKSVYLRDKKSWSYNIDDQEIILGKDILEIPTRRLTLGIACKNDIEIGFAIIGECRKLAKLCLCDYVSTEYISGMNPCQKISDIYYIVSPRLFRKIIDN